MGIPGSPVAGGSGLGPGTGLGGPKRTNGIRACLGLRRGWNAPATRLQHPRDVRATEGGACATPGTMAPVDLPEEPARDHRRRSRRRARGDPHAGPRGGRRGVAGGGRVRGAAGGRGRGRRLPEVEVERPANAAFGDFATNLAMKLARPLRRSPLDIAEAVAALAPGRRRRPRSSPPPRSRGRASSTCASPTPRTRTLVAGILAAPGAVGPDPGRQPPQRQRRVRVGQPDRAAHRGQRARRVRGRPAVPRPRGRRPGGHARVLLQRLGRAGRRTWAPRSSRCAAASRCPRTATRAPTSRSWRAERPGRGVGRGDGGRRERAARSSGRGRARACARASRRPSSASASGSTSGRARRRSTTRAGSSAPSSGCARPARSTSRTARSWFRSTAFGDDKDRVIYRSDGRPTYFAADIGYVTEKFSRGFDHLIYIWGVDHHGTIARNKNAAQAMGYDPDHYQVLLIGWVPLRRRRRGGLDVQAGGDVRDARRPARRGRARTRPAGSSPRARPTSRSTSTSSRRRRSRRTTRSTTCSTRTRGSPRSCARPPRPGWRPRTTWPGSSRASRRRRSSRVVARLPEVVEDAVLAEETQGITAYATELATQFHAFYRDARVVDPDRAGAVRPAARARPRDPDDARQRARAAGDLRARVDVGRGPAGPARRG